MELQVIKNKTRHENYLAEIRCLVPLDPDPESKEGKRLELLATLVEMYEKEHFPIEKPHPIEAIKFRMEQQGLKQKDLIPYMGSQSKVSEVLSGKRSLTLQMIRALIKDLGIPAEVFLQGSDNDIAQEESIDWTKFPIKEMVRRGWISTRIRNFRDHAEELIKEFLKPLDGEKNLATLFRGGFHSRHKGQIDKYALLAWVAQIKLKAKKEAKIEKYIPGTVDKEFLRKVAFLSFSENGPVLAKEFLGKNGIALIVEPHLPKTRLDGGSTILEDGGPVIGMTIRHDRIDNFWFTLLHELVHVGWHLNDLDEIYVDDMEIENVRDPKEKEADRFASDALVPRKDWVGSRARQQKTPEAIIEFARKKRVDPAIVAGKIRHEERNFRILNNMLGYRQVRKLFPGIFGN